MINVRWKATLVLFCALAATPAAHAQEADLHGPSAPANRFAHRFRLEAHTPLLQLSAHAGLLQPILLRGFNAALDVRVRRFVLSYSHGEGLEGLEALGALTPTAQSRGATLSMPFSTGGGIGVTLIDELYVLLDVKFHRFALVDGDQRFEYSTLTLGGEVGYRLFLWKGAHLALAVRYWPNVWSSIPNGAAVRGENHRAAEQGFHGLFANVLFGWAFDVL